MIMVAFSGTAIYIPNGDEEFDNFIKEINELDSLKSILGLSIFMEQATKHEMWMAETVRKLH